MGYFRRVGAYYQTKGILLKNLQDTPLQRVQFKTESFLDVVTRIPSEPKEVYLLLHGLQERGKRIYRKLRSAIPEDAVILAPNGSYPLPSLKNGETRYTYAWYFYDRASQTYHIDQKYPVAQLKHMIEALNLSHLPLTIIGFSQGGYLAPFVGQELKQTKHVIGIGCEFRTPLLKKDYPFKITAVHGADDKIILPEWAKKEVDYLKSQNIDCEFHLVPETGHEITPQAANVIAEILRK